MLELYREAFNRCYPQHSIDFKKTKVKGGGIAYWIVINGDRGEAPLTIEAMQEAIQSFNR